MEGSLIVGKTVKFSLTKETKLTGVVLDKILMKSKDTDAYPTTGYIIQEPDGRLHNKVVHWRLLEVY